MDALRGQAESAFRLPAQERAGLVEVALSVLLLTGAGLFLHSLWKVLAIDPGFRSGNVLMLNMDPRLRGYSSDATMRLFRSVEERLTLLPGVRSMSYVSIVPLSNYKSGSGFRPEGDAGTSKQLNVLVVSARYFETLGIPLLAGRNFESGGSGASHRSAILNETPPACAFPEQARLGARSGLTTGCAPMRCSA